MKLLPGTFRRDGLKRDRHAWRWVPTVNRYVCRVCGARSRVDHQHVTCAGARRDAVALWLRADKSHDFYLTYPTAMYGAFLFCRSCGVYSQCNIRLLGEPCDGTPAEGSYRRLRRQALRTGFHPEFLGKPVRLGRPLPMREMQLANSEDTAAAVAHPLVLPEPPDHRLLHPLIGAAPDYGYAPDFAPTGDVEPANTPLDVIPAACPAAQGQIG